MKYRALTNLSLRRSIDPGSDQYNEWHEWSQGTIFEPPPYMDVARALSRGIIEAVRTPRTGVTDG